MMIDDDNKTDKEGGHLWAEVQLQLLLCFFLKKGCEEQ